MLRAWSRLLAAAWLPLAVAQPGRCLPGQCPGVTGVHTGPSPSHLAGARRCDSSWAPAASCYQQRQPTCQMNDAAAPPALVLPECPMQTRNSTHRDQARVRVLTSLKVTLT